MSSPSNYRYPNKFIIDFIFGFLVGFMSGLFGVGGGF